MRKYAGPYVVPELLDDLQSMKEDTQMQKAQKGVELSKMRASMRLIVCKTGESSTLVYVVRAAGELADAT